eukprot:5293663-Karenia_brevis.AAC.1
MIIIIIIVMIIIIVIIIIIIMNMMMKMVQMHDDHNEAGSLGDTSHIAVASSAAMNFDKLPSSSSGASHFPDGSRNLEWRG